MTTGFPIMPVVSFAPVSLPLPCLPSLPPTLRDVEVPPLFRKRFILSKYRPVALPWRCYVLSLFQIHNETVNVWSHLLAALCVVTRFMAFTVLQGGGILGFRLWGPKGQSFSMDSSSLPLVLYVCSAATYLSCSAAAHLFQSRSELTLCLLFFLDHVGVAVHQYSCALALFFYSADATWTQSMLGQVFLPAAALLAWTSCAVCCYTKLRFQQPLIRKLLQVAPMGVAYLLDISPVVHRLSTYSWTSSAALPLHFLQVVLLLLSAFFFSCPIPECFCPGSFDIVGHAHQLFHVLLWFGMMAQQEALFHDFLWRRPALVRDFGEERLLLACASFPCLVLCCAMTALAMRRQACVQLIKEQQ